MSRDIKAEIKKTIDQNPITIFMKGNRQAPMCGFSAAAVRVFEVLGVDFATVDVLSDPQLREAIKTFSNWPTIPQIYIAGEFVGGSDILRDLYERGELENMVTRAIQAA